MPFDDDDDPLQAPGLPAAQPIAGGAARNLEDEDGMEDDGLPDYKLFAAMFEKRGVSSKTIRKGEKDFESHGTRAQDGALEASRRAMEEVLGYTRTHRSDAWIRAWYFPDWWTVEAADRLAAPAPARAATTAGAAGREQSGQTQPDAWLADRVVVMEHEKGSWMKDIGRTVPGSKDRPGVGRLWLLPEEALYLVERGTVDLWWPDLELPELLPVGEMPSPGYGHDDYDVGLPLSVEAAYSLLIGYDGDRGKTTLAKYQVYTHLKRAGFHILRAPPDGSSTTEDRDELQGRSPRQSLWQWLFSFVPSWERRPKRDPMGPLVSPGLYRSYGPIYQRLALLPRHKPSPRRPASSHSGTQEPFRVHYHVWKPGGAPFSKKSPPPPDFRIAVADTAESGVPTLEEVDALLGSTPWSPPGESMRGPGRLYQRLKHGYRNVLVAVVDCGLVNFMRFGEAAFGEERLFERFDGAGGGRGGKKSGRGGGDRH
ncbi:tRNA-splicing endonuclease subunit sen54 [Purpureocillium takamizusanense]|uniref:tRNA-splicing endonuclease subunit sen54 n=1 Tax=Purpureocillium takamizusanense TaxID=2060973 RepID=A0A9Q8QI82_9HYPO|nr:tRNA-splicing endonuclease subunit sen54 [Purpureocillium takamizusanense]UNI20263.1 tRNA-splicing endonuclease subunit sen54 [Purpureocillium takamizusanense]